MQFNIQLISVTGVWKSKSLINCEFLFLNTKNFTELGGCITLKSVPVRTFEIAKNILIYNLIFVVAEVVVLGLFKILFCFILSE